MISRNEKIRFGLIQAFYWAANASFPAFAVALARSRGVSATFIGIMIAGFMLCGVLGQLFWNGICDRLGNNKKIFLLANGLMLLTALLFYYSPLPLHMMLSYIAMGFVQPQSASNMDTWIIKRLGRNGSAYGPIRSMGSLGYALFIFFYGKLVADIGYSIMPMAMAILTLCTVLVAVTVKDKGLTEKAEQAEQMVSHKGAMKKLFASREYVFLLIILFIAGLSTCAIGQMKILIWESMGVSVAFQGYDGFASGLAQVPAMFIGAKFKAFSPKARFAGGIFLYLIMFLMALLANSAYLIVASSAVGGFAFGILLPAMRELIDSYSCKGLNTTAQGIGDAFFGSISGILSSIASGVLIDVLGVKTMIAASAVLMLAAAVLVPFTLFKSRAAAGSCYRAKRLAGVRQLNK